MYIAAVVVVVVVESKAMAKATVDCMTLEKGNI